MPKDLLYASFKDAPYTSQFVGSTFNELKDAQQVLNQTYDVARENDSKKLAVMKDLLQKAHPKDTEAAKALYESAWTNLQENAKAGDYENMLHKTTNEARQFNINASKIVAEKQRIDNYIKQLDEDKTINDADKADLKRMALSGQNSLQYDKNQGLVVGEGFKEDPFAKDVNFSKVIDEGYAKGFILDIIGGSGSQIVTDKRTGLPLLIDSKGNTKEVKASDIEAATAKYLTDDPDAQAHIDREARKIAFKAGYSDWRNVPKDLYNQAHEQAAYNLTNNAIKAAGIKYGFKQTESDSNSKMLSEAYFKKGNGETPEEPLNPQHGTGATEQFGQEAEKYEDFIKKVEGKKGNTFENEKKQAYISKNVLQRYMPEKLSDPISGEVISRDEFIKRKLETDKKNTGKGSRFVNQYQTEIEKAFEKERYSGLVEKEFNQKKKIGDVSTEPTIEEILKIEPNEALKQVYSVAPKGTPAKDVYKTWTSFNNKIRNVNTVNKPVLPAAREEMTTYILGSPVKGGENQTVTSRNGGLFDNEPVRVFKNGKLVKGYKTGKEAIEDGAISREALSKLNVTHRNLGFTAPDMSAPYVATGTVDEDDYEVQVQPTQEIQKYEKVLKVVEPLLTKGMKYKTAPIEIDGKIATLRVNPFTNTSFDFKNHKVGNVDPVITVDMEGSSNDWTGPYSVFKNWVLTHNPYQNLLQNQNFEGDNTTKTKKSATDKTE